MAQSVIAQRQTRAVKTLVEAVILAILPLLAPLIFKALPFELPLGPLAPFVQYLPLLCWAWALYLLWQAWQLWQSAAKANRATGAFIPAELKPLERQRWSLDSSNVGGDGQVVATSPSGKTYCIVFKGDRGRVGTDGRQVFRLYDNAPQPFPANFIEQTKQRSSRMQQRVKQVKSKQVVPVLAFTEAIVELDRNPISGVWVVQVADLRRLLLQQEVQPQL